MVKELLKKETIVVSFSGGRTSGFMCWYLQNYLNHIYNFVYIYANTGQEHEKTLEFVNNVDKLFNLNLIWVEAKVNEGRKGTSYTIVDFETASRNGEPFEEVIKKYGLPNKYFIHCTRELKLNPIHKWMADNGYKGCRQALGIRFDEFRRVKNDKGYIFPLATIGKFSKEDVLSFWKQQPFDLDLPEHYGNCFDGETKFLINDGLKTFKEMENKNTKVFNKSGWFDAKIRNFGQQKLFRLHLINQGRKIYFDCTEDHRWIVSKYESNQTRAFTKVLFTKDLRKGTKLISEFVNIDNIEINKIGVQNGFCFGDGSVENNKFVRIYVDNNKKEVLEYFDNLPLDKYNRIKIYKPELKNIPNVSMGKEYIKGFITGLIASDGCVTKSGIKITNANKENIDKIYELIQYLGISVHKTKEKIRDTNYKKNSNLYELVIQTKYITQDMIIRQFHKDRLNKKTTYPKMWVVDYIEDLNIIKDVYCATVNNGPDEFVLENGILTKNCLFCYKKSDKKLWLVAQEMPEAFDFIARMEQNYGKDGFHIFRHNRDVNNILNNDGYPVGYNMSSIDECGEECGVITLEAFTEKEKEVKNNVN